MKPQFYNSVGCKTKMNIDNFPILVGMGAVLLLQKGGVREPHWHTNVAELNYCIAGDAKMTIFSTESYRDTFTISPWTESFYSQRILA